MQGIGVAAAVGPVLLAVGHDWIGAYRPLLLAFIALPAALALAALIVREPRREGGVRPAPTGLNGNRSSCQHRSGTGHSTWT